MTGPQQEPESPGWDAIDTALRLVHGDKKCLHLAPQIDPQLGGDIPLHGLSIYPVTQPERHWHYVTYGMTELFEKESDVPDVSGWGFEFTMRVRAHTDKPPRWPLIALVQLAKYVNGPGPVLAPGHRMDTRAPLTDGSSLEALAFTEDPGLGTIESPFGQAIFLQLVGITRDELERMQASNTDVVLDELRASSPLLVTDPRR